MNRFFTTMMIVSLFFIISCDNKTTDDNTDSGDSGSEVVEKDNGEYVTAGASEDGGAQNSRDDGFGSEAGGDTDTGDSAPEDGGSAEREIVEADIYKVDGDILWVLNSYRGLAGIDISNPAEPVITGRAEFKGSPHEMYLQNGLAYILVNNARDPVGDDEMGRYQNKFTAAILVVDVSNPTALTVEKQFFLDGNIVDSRQVGDIIYLVGARYSYWYYGCNGEEQRGEETTNIISVNIADTDNVHEVDRASIEGNGHSVYVSQQSIYIADYNYDAYYNDRTDGKQEIFPVHRFDISDPDGNIVVESSFKSRVFASDRWKMHERGDTLFIIGGTDPWGGEKNAIESYDVSSSDTVEKLDDFVFMEGQDLNATRFEEDRAYAVTFERVDPLHVLSIKDPSALTELGRLDEIPGWSTHIEVRDGYLLAMGIDDSDWTAKVSMYDVSDPENPTEKGTVLLSDGTDGYSSSEANYDWKAFKIYDELGLILVPTRMYSYEDREYKNTLHLIDFDRETGLQKRGDVDSPSYVKRGVVIDDIIAAVGTTSVVMVDPADRDNPEVLSTLTVAYNIPDIDLCGNDLCGIYSEGASHWGNERSLALYNPDNDHDPVRWTSDAIADDYGWSRFMNEGDRGYLFTYSYGEYDYSEEGGSTDKEEPSIHLSIYDFSKEGKPEKKNDIELFTDSSASDYYSILYNADIDFTQNHTAALKKTTYHSYCEEDGNVVDTEHCDDSSNYYYVPRQQLYIMNLSDSEQSSYDLVQLDDDLRTMTYDAPVITRGNTVWTTDCDVHEFRPDRGELLKCYAVSWDVSDPEQPKEESRISIPGELVNISADGTYLYTYYRKYHHIDSLDTTVYKKFLFVLKRTDDGVSLHRTIPLADIYSYSEDENRYLTSRFIIQDKNIFIGEQETTYRFDDESCSYWYYLEENSFALSVLDIESGDTVYENSWENGVTMNTVKNGGVLVGISDHYYNGWYGYGQYPDEADGGATTDVAPGGSYYYGYSNEMQEWRYISATGKETIIPVPVGTDASGYGSYYGSYYYGTGKAVRTDNTVYIAADWKGIISATVK